MLEKRFKRLCQNYSDDKELIAQLWQEIEQCHTTPQRDYHTLSHLEAIFQELQDCDLTPLLAFATFYHDIVYDVLRKDNEKRSALLAQKRLRELTVPKALTQKVSQLIRQTQTHHSSSKENQLFLDADLTILGSNEARYKVYAQQVRKEYARYDDATYFKGRQNVLEIFLKKAKIYQTPYFHEKYEKQARINLLNELKWLKKRELTP